MKCIVLLAFLLSSFCSAHGAPESSAKRSPSSDFDAAVLTANGREALDRLSKCGTFSLGPTGAAAVVSEHERALRTLLAEADAAGAFMHLMANGSPAGRLYGLVGLYMKERAAFTREAALLRRELGTSKVNCISGCMMEESTVDGVVDRLEAGEFDLYLKAWQ